MADVHSGSSRILVRVSGSTTYKFAETNLFGPLRISIRSWATDPQGVHLGGTGMRLTPRDLARFGQLYLHNGFIDGEQVVPRAWIQQSITPRNAQKQKTPPCERGFSWSFEVPIKQRRHSTPEGPWGPSRLRTQPCHLRSSSCTRRL
ncbi:MAG: hypothetical protein HW389_2582 [Bacteroidetes bacterium]|nr:hypothetical protein [Bacteroidota bacterium]